MKKKFLFASAIVAAVFMNDAKAQQFSGPDDQSSTIGRSGKIELIGSYGDKLYVSAGGMGGGGYLSLSEQGIRINSFGSKIRMGYNDNNVSGFYGAMIVSEEVSGSTSTANSSDLGVFAGVGKTLSLGANKQQHIFVAANGNVGIGTSSPVGKLQVAGGGHFYTTPNIHEAGYIRLGINNDNQWHIRYRGTSHPATAGDFQVIGANNGTWLAGFGISKTTGAMYIGSNMETAGTVAAGNCGLKLFVDGVIGSKDLRLDQNNWCDYVFDATYKLRPINEVERFIKENKHLPEVPSEKEVVANGMAVGEMMKIHMKKIEELTLYLIEQNKQIEVLKRQNAALEALIK